MKIENVKSVYDCKIYCEGLANDFELGIIEKSEFIVLLMEYTLHLHDIFINSLKTIIETTDMKQVIVQNFGKGDSVFDEFFNDDIFDLDEVNNIKADQYSLGALKWIFENLDKLREFAKIV